MNKASASVAAVSLFLLISLYVFLAMGSPVFYVGGR